MKYLKARWILLSIFLLVCLNCVLSATQSETSEKEGTANTATDPPSTLDTNGQRRFLQEDDLVDEDDFEDDVLDDDSSIMAPANTKRDDEKSASIKKKSQITESEITRMHWCGESTNIILGQTIKGQIYRSVDRGETWEFKHDYEKLDGAGQLDKKNVKKATKIADIVESPVDSNLVFLIGASGVNWVSEDCGANFKPLNNGRKISQLKFHPTQRNWAMASIFTSCEDFDEDDEPCKIYREVYYTQDLGEHWNFLKDYVLEFEWGKGSADDQVPEELIFLMVQKNTVGHLDPDTWASGNTLISSTDFFRTSRTVVKGANRFAMMTEYIYVARALKNGEIDLVMSERANKFATFHKVKFPNKNTYKSFEYNLMESWSGAVFLFINLHTGSGVQYGNVYMSDASGKGFSLTLARVPLGTSGYADIEEVNSVEGVIIANKYSKSAITKMNKDTMNSAESTGVLKKLKNKAAASTKNGNKVNSDPQEMAQAIRDAKTEMATKKNPEIPIKTYISLNRGGNWQLLNAPEQTAKGKKINCKAAKGCSLHLHSYSSPNFPVPYAHNNAVGLIMGVGNLGTQLKYDMEEVNTYLSRDGGLTWLEIMNGPHILEFGDHGGIIVMAPLYKPTKTVLYSWNEGKTWVEYKISNTLLNIDAIEVEPTSKAMHFVLSARRAKTSKSKGVIFTIDFTDLHQPSCQGVTNPDTKDSDYETWTPYDGRHGDKCFLGRKITYVRRKRDSECYNPEEKEAVLFQENCPCTENDFECDFGYKRTESGQCEAAKSKTYEPPEDCSGYYSISKGYRRIPGNTCDGGGEYDPIQIACPGTWSIFSIRTLIILFLIGVAYYVVAESEWFVLVVDWINDKYSAIMSKNNDPYKYSKELGHNPDTAGDSDDDEKIVSKEDPSSSINQRGRADIEMKEDVKDSQNLIDINKYQDSDEDDDKQKIIQ